MSIAVAVSKADVVALSVDKLGIELCVLSRSLNTENAEIRREREKFVLYEHQSPLASVAELIGVHFPWFGFPVVPHALQIQWLPCWSTKMSRQGCDEN